MKEQRTLSKGWWISFAVIFVVIVCAIIIFVKPATKDDPGATGPITTDTAKTGCDVPARDTSSKPAMPKDLRWQAANGLTWPISDTYGPTQTKNGFGVCFAHSPLGAALAATTIAFSSYGAEGPRKAMEFYLIDSVGKPLAIASSNATASSSELTSRGLALAGFSITEYATDRASVSLVFSSPKVTTGFVATPVTLVWVNGDWRWKIPDNGVTDAVSYPVEGGFVKWAGSNG